MSLKDYSLSELEAEVARRNNLAKDFLVHDKTISNQWVVNCDFDDGLGHQVVGYFEGNPVDIAAAIGTIGYGLVFTPVNFKMPTNEMLKHPKNVVLRFTVDVSNLMLQDFVNKAKVNRPGHTSYCKNGLGLSF